MAEREPLTAVPMDDIGLDGEGRISMSNAGLVARLAAALAAKPRRPRPKPRPNGNCDKCNTSADCAGDPNSLSCSPNTKANCGCRLV